MYDGNGRARPDWTDGTRTCQQGLVAPRAAYWVMSVRSSRPRKLSWWIWCQERLPTGACQGEVAAPASGWKCSGWALSLDHFHLTGDTTQTKNKQQAIRKQEQHRAQLVCPAQGCQC